MRKNNRAFDEEYRKISCVEYQPLDTPSSRISYESTLSPFTAAGVYAYNNTSGYVRTQKSATSRLSREATWRVVVVRNANTKCRNATCGLQPAQSIAFESKYN